MQRALLCRLPGAVVGLPEGVHAGGLQVVPSPALVEGGDRPNGPLLLRTLRHLLPQHPAPAVLGVELGTCSRLALHVVLCFRLAIVKTLVLGLHRGDDDVRQVDTGQAHDLVEFALPVCRPDIVHEGLRELVALGVRDEDPPGILDARSVVVDVQDHSTLRSVQHRVPLLFQFAHARGQERRLEGLGAVLGDHQVHDLRGLILHPRDQHVRARYQELIAFLQVRDDVSLRPAALEKVDVIEVDFVRPRRELALVATLLSVRREVDAVRLLSLGAAPAKLHDVFGEL
mmetsp:Transcript_17831/g.62580  ORF Transcript_17831/g.62580 Transcript_17831/m.62580 type:complete len:286 (+) Transcript_17831:1735-2592(+)